MMMMMKLDEEIEVVATVGGAVPTRRHNHHLTHLLLTEGHVVQELGLASPRLFPGRAVAFTKPPLFQRNRLTCSGNPTFESHSVPWIMVR